MGDDREELQAFFATNWRMLFGLALSLTGQHHHDAGELVSATAEKMTRKWHQARSEDRMGWATTIMRNAWLDEVRRRRRRPEVLTDNRIEVAGGRDPEHAAISREAFVKGLQSLSKREWKVFALRAHGGMTFEEIGRSLHISPQLAHSDWSKIAKKLGAR